MSVPFPYNSDDLLKFVNGEEPIPDRIQKTIDHSRRSKEYVLKFLYDSYLMRENSAREQEEKQRVYRKKYYEDNKERIKQYREDNKEQQLIKSRKYREANRDRILEANKIKIQCECGVVLTKNGKSKHYKTKAHLRTIEDFKKISDDVNEYLLSM